MSHCKLFIYTSKRGTNGNQVSWWTFSVELNLYWICYIPLGARSNCWLNVRDSGWSRSEDELSYLNQVCSLLILSPCPWLKLDFFKGNWLFLQLDLCKSLQIKHLLNTGTGVLRKDCVGAGARRGQTFLWIILLSDSEGRRARLRASLSIWWDCHFNETDLALCQQTVSDESFSLSHPVHKGNETRF